MGRNNKHDGKRRKLNSTFEMRVKVEGLNNLLDRYNNALEDVGPK